MNKYPKNPQVFFCTDNLGDKTFDLVIFAFETGYKYFSFTEKNTNMSEFERAINSWFKNKKNINRDDYFFQGIISVEDIENNQARAAITRISKSFDEIKGIDCLLIERPSIDFNWTLRAWYELKVHQEWGVIKFAGVANFDKDQIKYLWTKTNFLPTINLIEMNIRNQRWDRISWCQDNGINVQAYGTLCYNNDSKKINLMSQEKNISVDNLINSWIINCGISPLINFDTEEKIFLSFKHRDFELSQSEILLFWKLNQFKNYFPEGFIEIK